MKRTFTQVRYEATCIDAQWKRIQEENRRKRNYCMSKKNIKETNIPINQWRMVGTPMQTVVLVLRRTLNSQLIIKDTIRKLRVNPYFSESINI